MSTDKNNAELSKLISLLGVTLSGNICYNCRPSRQYKDEDAIICATANYLLANGIILPPVKVNQSIWTAEPFTDNVPREGHITVLEYDSKGFCGFWASFGEIPLSAEFISEDIGKNVFFTLEEATNSLKELKDNA